jgi:carboxyl-terminal processing protease
MNFQNNNHTKVPHTKAGKTKSWIIGVIALVACMSPFAGAKSESDFYTELSRLNKVLSEVQRRYVEEVDAKELTDAAVNGLRTVLDPHTVVFDPKGADDLKIHTEGEFGGLGITIAIRDNVLTIITPLQGTPAFPNGAASR